MTADRGSIHLVAVGPWGHEVARRVSGRIPASTVTLLDLDWAPDSLKLGPAQGRVLIAGRAVPGLAAMIDDAAYRSRTPWLAVVMAHPHLQIGPAVAPGRGACYDCWQRRLRQHAPAPEVDAALHRHYEQHPTDHPAGHLTPSCVLAASMAVRLVDRWASDPDRDAGWLRQIDLVTRHMTKGRAAGVHGCERCGLGRHEPGRSHERLSVAMGQALGWAS